MKRANNQLGAVSLFVVIFATLLITVVTVSFISIMIQSQQRATANNLSQSAYDSAQAGVEDGKRAILLLQRICSPDPTTHECTNAAGNYTLSSPCNAAVSQLSDYKLTNNEVKIQTGQNSNLNQAYTCVKISMDTDDYIASLDKDSSQIVPLAGTAPFSSIKLDWFDQNDLQGSSTDINLPEPGETSLLSQGDWVSVNNPNLPSIMRTQLIEFNNNTGFSLSDLDSNNKNTSNDTLFLYPSPLSNVGTINFTDDARPPVGTAGAPTQVSCSKSLAIGGYACSATLELPYTVGTDYTAYLNLKSLYRSSSFRVTLINSDGSTVSFNGVQPMIDSTGRANDLFRRVQTRVEMTNGNFPYPQGEIYITGNLCKTFFVTNNPIDYSDGSCSP
ncbi:MAG TPA: hypothetical protein VMR16_02995 [Candidatus Saccharimonadales bacterium]|nr:hypothetical protein [Candidatus Saccharimonadales bacterium]